MVHPWKDIHSIPLRRVEVLTVTGLIRRGRPWGVHKIIRRVGMDKKTWGCDCLSNKGDCVAVAWREIKAVGDDSPAIDEPSTVFGSGRD